MSPDHLFALRRAMTEIPGQGHSQEEPLEAEDHRAEPEPHWVAAVIVIDDLVTQVKSINDGGRKDIDRTKEEPKPVRNQKPTPKRTKPKPLQPDGTLKLKDYLKLKSAARNENFQSGNLSVSDAECVENSLQGKTTEARKASGIE